MYNRNLPSPLQPEAENQQPSGYQWGIQNQWQPGAGGFNYFSE
jgi:hypothetical protein